MQCLLGNEKLLAFRISWLRADSRDSNKSLQQIAFVYPDGSKLPPSIGNSLSSELDENNYE